MIKLEHVSKTFSNNVVLKDISLNISKGEIFGLIGKNGAGKTTLLSIIAGLSNSTSGTCLINGQKNSKETRLNNVSYLPDVPTFFDFMTVNEFLDFLYMRKTGYKEKRDALIKLVGLNGKTVIKTMSRGMRQRLGMAATLVNDPDVILLDEPTSALDPMGRYELSQILLHLKQQGKTIILSTHILTDMETICDRVGFLHNGMIVKTISPKSTEDSQKVRITFKNTITEDILSDIPLSINHEDDHNIVLAGNITHEETQKELLYRLCLLNNPIIAINTIGTDLDVIFREVCL
jgi:ABC-2 type transport system ATP-binding protein